MVAEALNGLEGSADKKAAKKAVMALIRQANAEKSKQAHAIEKQKQKASESQPRLAQAASAAGASSSDHHVPKKGASASTALPSTGQPTAGTKGAAGLATLRKKKLREARKADRAKAIEVFKSKSKVVLHGPSSQPGKLDMATDWASIEPCIVTAQANFFSKPIRGTLKSLGFTNPTALQAYAWPVLSVASKTRQPPLATLLESAAGNETSRMLAYLAPLVEQLKRFSARRNGQSQGRTLRDRGEVSTPRRAEGLPTGGDSNMNWEAHRHPPTALIVAPSKAHCLLLGKCAEKFERVCGVRITVLTGASAARVGDDLEKARKRRRKRRRGEEVTPSTNSTMPSRPETRAQQLEEIYKFRSHAICTTPGNLHEALKDPDFPLYCVTTVVLDDIQQLMDRGFAPQLDTLFNYLLNVSSDSRRQRHLLPGLHNNGPAAPVLDANASSPAITASEGEVNVVFATTTPKGTWKKNLPLMSSASKPWLRSLVRICCATPPASAHHAAVRLPPHADRLLHMTHASACVGASAKIDFLAQLIRSEVVIDKSASGDGGSGDVDLSKLNRAERRAYKAQARKQKSQLLVVVRRDHVQALYSLLARSLVPDGDDNSRSCVGAFSADVSRDEKALSMSSSVVVLSYGAVTDFAVARETVSPTQQLRLAGAVLFDIPPSTKSYERVAACVAKFCTKVNDKGPERDPATSGGKGKLHIVIHTADVSAEQLNTVKQALTRYGVKVPAVLEARASSHSLSLPMPTRHVLSVPQRLLQKIGNHQAPARGMELNIVNTSSHTVGKGASATEQRKNQHNVPASDDVASRSPESQSRRWVDKRERRLAHDGIPRTRKEFQQLYGGTAEWNAAQPSQANGSNATAVTVPAGASNASVSPSSPAFPIAVRRDGKTFVDKRERRYADDGNLYTRSQFQKFYKGTAEWDAAPRQET